MKIFYPLNVGISDIILGIQWLEKGVILMNQKTQVMKFEWRGEMVKLVGDPMLIKLKYP